MEEFKMNRETHVMKVNEYTTQAWENAFTVFVEGVSVHGKEEVERAIKIMNAIDKELTATLINTEVTEEVAEVTEVVETVETIEETPEEKSHRFMIARKLRFIESDGVASVKKVEHAHELKAILEAEGKKVKIKNHFGRHFSVIVL
jgi:hypothetical protein